MSGWPKHPLRLILVVAAACAAAFVFSGWAAPQARFFDVDFSAFDDTIAVAVLAASAQLVLALAVFSQIAAANAAVDAVREEGRAQQRNARGMELAAFVSTAVTASTRYQAAEPSIRALVAAYFRAAGSAGAAEQCRILLRDADEAWQAASAAHVRVLAREEPASPGATAADKVMGQLNGQGEAARQIVEVLAGRLRGVDAFDLCDALRSDSSQERDVCLNEARSILQRTN